MVGKTFKAMKTHVITISRVFPTKHINAGEPTNFHSKIIRGHKIHTVRSNYAWWSKKIDEVNAGIAVLQVREWSGKPYNSPQTTLITYTKDSGIGYEPVRMAADAFNRDIYVLRSGGRDYMIGNIAFAANDGLTLEQFNSWFGPKKFEGIIIHFTSFRYLKQ